jgi:hypothetical protein
MLLLSTLTDQCIPEKLLPAAPACAQPGKCLYTTVRELVENSLDAAEDAGRLPEIDITMCAQARCASCERPPNAC